MEKSNSYFTKADDVYEMKFGNPSMTTNSASYEFVTSYSASVPIQFIEERVVNRQHIFS